jgi:hypothetical protein
MWPFQQTPTKRLQHRLLKRLRHAYLITEDLPSHRLANNNLHHLGKASLMAADDQVLYQHWIGQPMPAPLAHAITLERKAWEQLMTGIHEMVTQAYHAEAFEKEAKALQPIGHAIQELIQYELNRITHPDQDPNEAALRSIEARIKP